MYFEYRKIKYHKIYNSIMNKYHPCNRSLNLYTVCILKFIIINVYILVENVYFVRVCFQDYLS